MPGKMRDNEELIAVGIAALIGGYIGYRIGAKPCPVAPPCEDTSGKDFWVGAFVGAGIAGGLALMAAPRIAALSSEW